MPPIKIGTPITISDIKITVKSVSTGKLEEKKDAMFTPKMADIDHLLVKISLENISEGRIITIQNSFSETVLSDEFDNNYQPKDLGIGRSGIIGIAQSEKMRPESVLADMIVFDLPLKNTKKYKLVFEPKFYKNDGKGMLEKISKGKFILQFTREDVSD
jgi:hypothetical protein